MLAINLLSLSLKSVIIVSYAILAPSKNSFCAFSSNFSFDWVDTFGSIFYKISSNWGGGLPSNPVLLPKIPLSLKKTNPAIIASKIISIYSKL